MNILFINRMMGISWGGGENYDYHLARGLQARGHQVLILTGRKQEAAPPPRDVECLAIRTPYLRHHMYKLAGRLPLVPGVFAETDLWLFREKAKRTIERVLRERRIDLVQILALPGTAKWLSRRVPWAMRFPGPPAWFQSGLLRRLQRGGPTRMFTHGDAVSYFRDRLSIPVAEVPPGIHREWFRPPDPAERAAARAHLDIGAGDFVLSTVGRLIAGKGHEFLLESLARRVEPRLRVLVAGDGPLRARYEALAAQSGMGRRIRFVGQTDSAGVARILWASDAFCLLSSYENYSNAVLEAMATGLPVIASNAGGFPRQIVENENGHLIALNDHGGFLARVDGLIREPERRRRLAANAARFAGSFSWDTAAGRVEDIYAELVR
jgi:glycosyltransferase involved in cell wall biosynthesis